MLISFLIKIFIFLHSEAVLFLAAAWQLFFNYFLKFCRFVCLPVSSWDPFVTPVIPLCSAPFYPDGIAASCAPVSSVALRSCVSAMPDHLINAIQLI